MKYIMSVLVLALIVLHQDEWYWDDDRLVWGFMPIGLLYHAGLSVAAGVVWFLTVQLAWPSGLEEKTWEAVKSHEHDSAQESRP